VHTYQIDGLSFIALSPRPRRNLWSSNFSPPCSPSYIQLALYDQTLAHALLAGALATKLHTPLDKREASSPNLTSQRAVAHPPTASVSSNPAAQSAVDPAMAPTPARPAVMHITVRIMHSRKGFSQKYPPATEEELGERHYRFALTPTLDANVQDLWHQAQKWCEDVESEGRGFLDPQRDVMLSHVFGKVCGSQVVADLIQDIPHSNRILTIQRCTHAAGKRPVSHVDETQQPSATRNKSTTAILTSPSQPTQEAPTSAQPPRNAFTEMRPPSKTKNTWNGEEDRQLAWGKAKGWKFLTIRDHFKLHPRTGSALRNRYKLLSDSNALPDVDLSSSPPRRTTQRSSSPPTQPTQQSSSAPTQLTQQSSPPPPKRRRRSKAVVVSAEEQRRATEELKQHSLGQGRRKPQQLTLSSSRGSNVPAVAGPSPNSSNGNVDHQIVMSTLSSVPTPTLDTGFIYDSTPIVPSSFPTPAGLTHYSSAAESTKCKVAGGVRPSLPTPVTSSQHLASDMKLDDGPIEFESHRSRATTPADVMQQELCDVAGDYSDDDSHDGNGDITALGVAEGVMTCDGQFLPSSPVNNAVVPGNKTSRQVDEALRLADSDKATLLPHRSTAGPLGWPDNEPDTSDTDTPYTDGRWGEKPDDVAWEEAQKEPGGFTSQQREFERLQWYRRFSRAGRKAMANAAKGIKPPSMDPTKVWLNKKERKRAFLCKLVDGVRPHKYPRRKQIQHDDEFDSEYSYPSEPGDPNDFMTTPSDWGEGGKPDSYMAEHCIVELRKVQRWRTTQLPHNFLMASAQEEDEDADNEADMQAENNAIRLLFIPLKSLKRKRYKKNKKARLSEAAAASSEA